MEVLNHRKMRYMLDLLRPSLQGKIHKKQTQMKETHDPKGLERKNYSGRECVCQVFWARTKMVDRDDHSCDRSCVIRTSTPGRKRVSKTRRSSSFVPERTRTLRSYRRTHTNHSILPNREAEIVASIPATEVECDNVVTDSRHCCVHTHTWVTTCYYTCV